MANVSFFFPTDMSGANILPGSLTAADITGFTSTEITISDGNNTVNLFGSFSYSLAGVSGTLTGLRAFHGAFLAADVSGLSVDASVAETLFNNNKLQDLFKLALTGHDVINGSNSNDVLIGYNGNDAFTGGGGNDVIEGGGTNNTAVYSGMAAQYSITTNGSTFTVADTVPGRDGTDTLTDIQNVQFSDRTVTLTAGPSTSAPNSLNDSITELYIGYYNRAPDPGGETYWAGRLQDGMGLIQIAQSYSVQTESTNLYPFLANPNTASTAAVQAFIVSVYANLFNRAPDTDGENYWVNQLQTGKSTVGGAIINIISGAQLNDLATINNKVIVGDYYDTQIYTHNVKFSGSVALAALSSVTFDVSSIATAEALVDAYVQTAPHAAQSATASQTDVNLVGMATGHDLVNAA